MVGNDDHKQTTPLQEVSIFLAQGFSIITVGIGTLWCIGPSSENYLGGISFSEDELFNLHPYLMIIGIGFFCTQGLLAYRFFRFGKRINKLLHGISHACAVVCVALGLTAVFHYKNEKEYANLYSMHSWLGIFTVTLFFGQYVVGFLLFYFPGASNQLRKEILPFHITLGLFIYFCAIFTIENGITQKNQSLGCSYTVSSVDNDPASHYSSIPAGCRVSGGLGITVLLLSLFTAYAIMDLRPVDLKENNP